MTGQSKQHYKVEGSLSPEWEFTIVFRLFDGNMFHPAVQGPPWPCGTHDLKLSSSAHVSKADFGKDLEHPGMRGAMASIVAELIRRSPRGKVVDFDCKPDDHGTYSAEAIEDVEEPNAPSVNGGTEGSSISNREPSDATAGGNDRDDSLFSNQPTASAFTWVEQPPTTG